MKNLGRFLLFAALLPSLAFAYTKTEIPGGAERESVEVYLPSSFSPSQKLPVILLLHGYTGNAFLIDSYFGLSNEVDKREFILVVPNGRKDSHGFRYWNASPACCDFDHSDSGDVGYLKSLLGSVVRQYHADPGRIFVAGHSNGGFMAHRLACEPDSGVKAIVSFAGTTALGEPGCKPAQPVSVLQIHAVDDDTIAYDGDPVGYPGLQPYSGAQTTVNMWAALDRCEKQSTQAATKDLAVLIPGQDTKVLAWQGCDHSEVQLWEIQAYPSWLHAPHTPLLRGEFTESILDFLLQPQNIWRK